MEGRAGRASTHWSRLGAAWAVTFRHVKRLRACLLGSKTGSTAVSFGGLPRRTPPRPRLAPRPSVAQGGGHRCGGREGRAGGGTRLPLCGGPAASPACGPRPRRLRGGRHCPPPAVAPAPCPHLLHPHGPYTCPPRGASFQVSSTATSLGCPRPGRPAAQGQRLEGTCEQPQAGHRLGTGLGTVV